MDIVRLRHPDNPNVRTTGRATAQPLLDTGWEIIDDGAPAVVETPGVVPTDEPQDEQDDHSDREE